MNRINDQGEGLLKNLNVNLTKRKKGERTLRSQVREDAKESSPVWVVVPPTSEGKDDAGSGTVPSVDDSFHSVNHESSAKRTQHDTEKNFTEMTAFAIVRASRRRKGLLVHNPPKHTREAPR